jgi:hypothetical protein
VGGDAGAFGHLGDGQPVTVVAIAVEGPLPQRRLEDDTDHVVRVGVFLGRRRQDFGGGHGHAQDRTTSSAL